MKKCNSVLFQQYVREVHGTIMKAQEEQKKKHEAAANIFRKLPQEEHKKMYGQHSTVNEMLNGKRRLAFQRQMKKKEHFYIKSLVPHTMKPPYQDASNESKHWDEADRFASSR